MGPLSLGSSDPRIKDFGFKQVQNIMPDRHYCGFWAGWAVMAENSLYNSPSTAMCIP